MATTKGFDLMDSEQVLKKDISTHPTTPETKETSKQGAPGP